MSICQACNGTGVFVSDNQPLSRDELMRFLDYDYSTGLFIWKVVRGKARTGATAGTMLASGYLSIGVGKVTYYAHRLAWLFAFGKWPEFDLDHIDGVKSNNVLWNLRECTASQNQQNLSKFRKDRLYPLGVHVDKKSGKYRAALKLKGKTYYFGLHKTPEEAYEAYCEGKKKFHAFNPVARGT